MQALLLLNLIVPFVLYIVGYALKKNPVTDMRSHSGYNTPRARKSQVHWDYAQTIAPDIFMSVGKKLAIVEMILIIAFVVLKTNIIIAIIIGMGVGFAFMIYGFCVTESRIKEKVGI